MILIKAHLEDFENKGLLKDCAHKTADDAFSMISTTLDLKEAMDGAFFLQVYYFYYHKYDNKLIFLF